jgi:hypothetical protein
MFALAVVAVTLPGVALAGEPVPMSDSELDSTVAAGLLEDFGRVLAALEDPKNQTRLENFLKVEENSKQITSLINLNKAFLLNHDKDIRPRVPEQFRYLLPSPPAAE